MSTINQVKQLAEADTPLLFFRCTMPSGDVQYWSTHAVPFNGQNYSARILKHNLFSLQLSGGDAMDGISQLSLTLANADSTLSELESTIGFKGSQLTVYFAFVDLPSLTVTTESTVLFTGSAGDPDQITESTFTLSFTSKLNLQRIALPNVRIQRLCPWSFPSTVEQRTEAVSGGSLGKYSPYYGCGYSADVMGGRGNFNGGQAFTTCDKSRAQCQQRGMFSTDNSGNVTQRYGGFEFVPSQIMVRTSGAKSFHLSPVLDPAANYNDPVPMVYGTGWINAPMIFSRNDGNLTHMEVLLSLGAIQSLQGGTIQGAFKVVVNDVEIPQGVVGTDMTTTGWYNIVSTGNVKGAFDLDFTDANNRPLGDPYGSMAVIEIVVPNRISSGRSVPTIEVLLQGLLLDIFNTDGSLQTTAFSANPAWVILDILRRCGWQTSDVNMATFVAAAEFCDYLITTTDLNGNSIQVPRFQCNLILTKRQSAAEIIRGIRVASSLMIRFGANGLLELLPETTIAMQQPTLPDGSNSTATLNGGWPVYEFSDASGPFSGIARTASGASSIILSSRSLAETSNRLSLEYQDSFNEFQQDSLSVVNSDDLALIGYEISSQSTALGVANASQATRVLLQQLDKSTDGNRFIEFQTSFRAMKVRPGDIIAITYLKEGMTRVPFRVIKLLPSTNYQTVTIYAQIHDDDWYSDSVAVLGGAGRQPGSQGQTPLPLLGPVFNSSGTSTEFTFSESIQQQSDGSMTDTLTVNFVRPATPASNSPSIPLLTLSPQISSTGGTLAGGQNLYYAISAVDGAGDEGTLSFTVLATIPQGPATHTVTLTGISLPSNATGFNVYRGTTPQLFYRIATALPVATTYTDIGAAYQPIGPPDPNFDHANFYYRFELAGPFPVTASTPTTITNSDMGATPSAYVGMTARIIGGTGAGQENQITANDSTTLTVTPAWSTLPDTTSQFVVTEASWRFGAVTSTSPAQFEIPYRIGTVLEISGRSANVNNQECAADLCPNTEAHLGQQSTDSDVAPAPAFTLLAPGQGNLTISQIGFASLTNTDTVTSGTLQAVYWNELDTPSPYWLNAQLNATSTTVSLNRIASPQPQPGDTILVGADTPGVGLVGAELMTIQSVNAANNTYTVTRGVLNSTAAIHQTGELVLHLQAATFVLPFADNFFENRASQNYLHSMDLPEVRVAAAELFVTNAFGNSETTAQCYTGGTDGGLRTLSGGQFSFQVSGYLAVEQNAAPPLLVEANHAVRDIRATVSEAAGETAINVSILQNGVGYCNLSIAPGSLVSQIVDGVDLPPLVSGATLTLSITQVGQAAASSPGSDLTVTIRL
jgi:Putative phage tail protein